MNQLERIERELKLAGYRLEPIKEEKDWTDDDYTQAIGLSAYETCKTFCGHEHSGMSAEITINMINKLLKGELLTPITNNPEEWIKHDEEKDRVYYQSQRRSSCFSDDLKTYYDIDEDCNRNWELDEEGNRTGWYSLKPNHELLRHPFPEKKEKLSV